MPKIQEIHKCDAKKVHPSEEAAKRADRERRRTYGGFAHHTYRCEWCGGWHLTKRKPR